MQRYQVCFTSVIFLTSMLLSSCMMGSIALSGAQAVYDRKNIQDKLDDNYTTLQAYRAIENETKDYKNDTHISVATFHDAVVIMGQVPDTDQKNEITRLVKNIAGDRQVFNFIEMASPCSAITRASDTWITSKIKAKLIATNGIDPSKIKVITENGTVFLMGIVPREEAATAVDIAQATSGVQSVVKVFSYLEITKVAKAKDPGASLVESEG